MMSQNFVQKREKVHWFWPEWLFVFGDGGNLKVGVFLDFIYSLQKTMCEKLA